MEMFLMVLCMSMFGLAITAAAFGAATRTEQQPPAVQPKREPAASITPARFFAESVAAPRVMPPRVPLEALLLQIERHVRLEQAAAESFLEAPTSALLHSKTISPLVQ